MTVSHAGSFLKSPSLCRLLIPVVSIVFWGATLLQAQVSNSAPPNYLTGTGPNFAAPYPAEMGTVDAATGNLHLEIPLGSFPQRGSKAPLVSKLVYDSHIWTPQWDPTSAQFFWTILSWGSITAPRTYGTWGLAAGTNGSLIETGGRETVNGSGTITFCESDFILWDASGTQHYFPVVSADPSSGCPVTIGNAYASDSSGYYLEYNIQTVPYPYVANVYAPDGTLVFNNIEGNAQGNFPNSPYMLAEDSNGNYLYSNNAVETDTLGRAMGTTLASPYSVSVPTTVPVFNSQDTTTGTSSYTINTATIPVQTNFNQTGIVDCTSSCTAEVIQSIVLPDNSTYAFTYDCDKATGTVCSSQSNQTAYYGTLTSMTLPTGQTITYGYTNFKDAAGNMNHWLSSKTTGTAVWLYSPSVTANGGWKTSYSCLPGTSMDGCQQTTVTRPDNSKEITAFALNNGVWPMTITSYDTDGATVLSTVTNSYDFTNPCTLTLCFISFTQENGAQYIRRTSSSTTLPVPGGSSITKKTSYSYDSPQNGNITAVQEWAFRNGTASTATFPSVPDRATYIKYATIGTNILNKPLTVTVCNNVGNSDSNCSIGGATIGGTTVARTTTTYDNYGNNNSAPLASITGAINHDDTNYSSSVTARGNPTQVSRWVSGTGSTSTSLTTALSYDSTGQVIKVVDSNLNSTTYSYSDKFYHDNGSDPYNGGSGPPSYSPTKTNAYVTQVTDPIGSTSMGYYFGSGKAALSADYNSVTSYSHFVDPFDRPTASDSPIGWSLDSYTVPPNVSLTHYSAVADTSPSLSCVSCITTNTVLDSLGREISSTATNNLPGPASVTNTYDGMNRVVTVSHPNFGTSDPNDVVETSKYDGFGRSLGATHPDGEATKIAYGAAVTAQGGLTAQKSSAYGVGFPILSVDEQGNLRQKWLDGFGRVIEVDEPSGAGGLTSANYTNYSYDVLGNLTSVVEGVQTRSYTYDGLSRLTQEVTPESGTVKYSYFVTGTTLCSGDPSSVCSRTDARGIVTNYTYDTANRLKSITHVPTTTGPRSYTYGTSATAFNIGRLLTMTDPSGSETYTYDQLGRIIQLAKKIGTTTYNIKYAYNSGGQLTQITYPSGRNIYYNYDAVGHLCMVDALNDGSCVPAAANPYVTLSNYDAAGRALKANYNNGVLGLATYDPQRSQLSTLNYGDEVSTPVYSVSSTSGIATVSVVSALGIQRGDYITISANSNPIFDGTFQVLANFISSLQIIFPVPGESGTDGTLTDPDAIGISLLALNYFYQEDSTNCPNGNSLGNNGQIQCINDVSGADSDDAGRSVSYKYDFLGRLSTASTPGSTTYPAWSLAETYDRYGNLSKQSGTNAPPISLSVNAANNRINTSGYTYDASGNLTATPNPGGTSSSYDGEECLTNFSSAASTATYTCDGNGIRVKKVVTGTDAVTTVTIYSGGRAIAEYDNGAAVTSPTREYIYARNLLATVTGSTGGTGGTIVYQHRDHLSPRLYTSATGTDAGEQGTFPFGESWYNNNTTSNWVFTTYERDAESGNDNALARSYASSQARFLSPDPIEGNPSSPQSWNRYSYVGNDPINVTDPTGEFWLLDAIEALVGIFSDDPGLILDALSDTVTDPCIYACVLTGAIDWGATAGGAGIAADVGAAVSLGAGSASAGAFAWGGANDPGGEVNWRAQALFSPNSVFQDYWTGSQKFIGAFAENMAYTAVGGAADKIIGGAIESYIEAEGALVPKGPLGSEPGPVSSFTGKPRTTQFGNEVHQNFGKVLTEQTETTPEDWIMRTKPGQTGVDAEYVGPASRNPGFNYAELKPAGYSSQSVGEQIGRWGLPEGETSIWWYNESGIIGQTLGVW
jgi:RHS repeat-associated protein